MNRESFVSELGKLHQSSNFLTLLGYQNAANEVADYSLVFHFDYKNAVRRSIETLKDIKVKGSTDIRAKLDLLESLKVSLRKLEHHSMEELDEVYTYFKGQDDSYIKGIKAHRKTGTLYLFGLINSKRIISPGSYLDRNGSDLAKAKGSLRKKLPVGKYRSFIVAPDKFDSLSVQGINLSPPR